jgi:Ca2+-binding EF-hand superfamily protein
VFQGLDVDHSKSISFEEIKNFLFGSKGFEEDYLRKIIQKYDADSSGDLSIDQFKNLMFELLK